MSDDGGWPGGAAAHHHVCSALQAQKEGTLHWLQSIGLAGSRVVAGRQVGGHMGRKMDRKGRSFGGILWQSEQ